jgi:hypothetical protein
VVAGPADATPAPPGPFERREPVEPAGLAAPIGPVPETLLWEGAPHGLLNPIESHAIRWILTTERLQIVCGMLSRSTEEIELMRVRDVSYEQSLTQRALGIGNIHVIGTDATTPMVVMHDIEDPEQVKELLRQAVLDQRRRQRVREVEGDRPLY